MSGTRSLRPSWDPAQYARFADDRTRPAHDLIDRIPLDRPRTLWDLGCGTGEITQRLALRWPEARVIGLDSSPAMLDRARGLGTGIEWRQGAIEDWSPEEAPELVFSNAALQWVEDHETLLPRLLRSLAAGGALAVQMPRNFEAPSHRLMREAAEAGPWRSRLARKLRPTPVLTPAAYFDLLAPHARRLDVWETDYLHVLEGDQPVVDWVKGTGLRPLIDALGPGHERDAFLADYSRRIALAYPRRPDGRTLFPFRRLFLVALV